MDPVTQGALGSTATLLVRQRRKRADILFVFIIGFLVGMAADLDVLIRSNHDPLLFLDYHRHFTHSLFFIPFGGLITAGLCYLFLNKKQQLTFFELWFYCCAAYATHALIDACTTYGTQLFWPLSDERVAWNNMSIVDPLYTIPILTLIVLHVRKLKAFYLYLAVFWIFTYPLLGLAQRDRTQQVAYKLAESRGHTPEKLEVKPSFANLILWKSVYLYDGVFYVDGIRNTFTQKIYPGDKIKKIENVEAAKALYPWLDLESQQAKDITRFKHFSKDYIAQHPTEPLNIIDIRYSVLPHEIKPLWYITLDKNADATQHVSYITDKEQRKDTRLYKLFFKMLKGEDI